MHTPLEATEADLKTVSALDFSSFRNKEKAKLRAAMLLAMDRAVGRIMQTLRAENLDQNTLVIFTNDNGDYGGNGPFSGGKGSTAEGGIRVPFMLRWDGHVPAGIEYHEIVSTMDIMPTVITAGGGCIDPAWKLDGVDLIPYLTGTRKGPVHKHLYWRMGQERAVREGDWKIRYNGGSGYGYKPKPGEACWSLYNLADDPGKRRNLKDTKPYVFARLKTAYDQWEQQLAEPLWPFGASGQMGQWEN